MRKWVKNEPLSAAASCASSRPELEAISAMPSAESVRGTSTSKGWAFCRPLLPVHPPPLQASMMPTRTAAPASERRRLSSRKGSGLPPG